jgi:hypothetical protein
MAALLALHPDEPEYHCHCDACWENWTTNDHLLLSRPLTAPIAAFARAA